MEEENRKTELEAKGSKGEGGNSEQNEEGTWEKVTEEEGNANQRDERTAENGETNARRNTGKPRTEDEMMTEKDHNTQASLTDLVTIALTKDSHATSTEEQSADNKKRKIPLKENQTSTEVRTKTPTKDSKGEHRGKSIRGKS